MLTLWGSLAVALIGGGAAAGAAAGASDPVLIYTAEPAALAIHDGTGSSLRQLPAYPNRRWPGSRLVAKVRGEELSHAATADEMARRLRAAWRAENAALVGVDEILPAQWTTESARRLREAVDLLGRDRHKVVFYAGPSMVEQVGRADPRRRLSEKLRVLVGAMSRARATYLMTYRGSMRPFPAREMAVHPTRWIGRWPGEASRLRIMLGPDGGLGQATLWARVRSTPAGRQLLANGIAAYGVGTASEGRAWQAQHRAFLRAPTISPTGRDARVPTPGGLELSRRGASSITVRITRRGRAVMRLVPRGEKRGRVIKKLVGPTRKPRVVRLPRDVRPGRYTVVAVLLGDGLRDRARLPLVIRPQ